MEAERMIIKMLFISALAFAAAVSTPPALAQAPLPGCPGTTSAAQEQCTVAQELLDIYNGEQMSDTSQTDKKTNSYQYCVTARNSEMQLLAKDFEVLYKNLKAKGDPNAALDAVKPSMTREANILSMYMRCISRPLPLRPPSVPADPIRGTP
jgi:hypothetical protein